MLPPIDKLPADKKLFFASDFHLGVPDKESSLEREKKIVRWLDSIKDEAHTIFLLGDIFDFWFEYAHAIPKGFVRLQGKLAELTDNGIAVKLFTGNHDMWMFDYFPQELNIPVYREPQQLAVNGHLFYLGHGDGLGPGDPMYKLLKKVFQNPICQWLFARIHPNLGLSIANYWSRKSRISNSKEDESFKGEEHEWLWQYASEVERKTHHDYYVFGHRHLPLDLKVGENSRYINLGEWVNYSPYGVFDGKEFKLLSFE